MPLTSPRCRCTRQGQATDATPGRSRRRRVKRSRSAGRRAGRVLDPLAVPIAGRCRSFARCGLASWNRSRSACPWEMPDMGIQRAGEVFKLTHDLPDAPFGCGASALMWEKPGAFRIACRWCAHYSSRPRSASSTTCLKSVVRHRTTPWTARSESVSTISRVRNCSFDSRGGCPFERMSRRPSGPLLVEAMDPVAQGLAIHAADRATCSRSMPSSTAASDSNRQLWLACLEAATSRRRSEAE